VLVAFLLVPHLHFASAKEGIADLFRHYWPVFTLHLLFLPNLARVLYQAVPGTMQCWSLGVEEQFYFIWPLLMRVLGKTPLRVLFAVILAKSFLLRFFAAHGPLIAYNYLRTFCIEDMAVGGVAACYFFYARKPGQHRARVAVSLCVLASCVAWLVLGRSAWQISSLILYAGVIVAAAQLPKLGGRLHPPLEYLGNISYGIYMLHPLAVLIVINILVGSRAFAGWQWLASYVFTFALSIGFAAVSYHLMEAPFLRLKQRFTSNEERLKPVCAAPVTIAAGAIGSL
jgi:peptidoglycan/LPS O-acetylase OafA/YrhL